MISIIDEKACVIGTMISIIQDSEILKSDKLLNEIKLKTTGTETTITHEELSESLKKYYKYVYTINLEHEGEGIYGLTNLLPEIIDNINSFGIMLWSGNELGNNQHCVRLVNFNLKTITFMDSSYNELIQMEIGDLHNHTPLGCYLILVSRKKIESFELESKSNQKNEVINLEGIHYDIPEDVKNFLQNDDALFHYTKSNTAIEHILQSGRLRGTKLKDFSDSKEGMLTNPISTWWGKDELYFKSFEIQNNISMEIAKLNVFCFSSNIQVIDNFKTRANQLNNRIELNILKPIYGFVKDRMWDTYGDNFQGVCLVFSKEKLMQYLEKNNILNDNNFVNYRKDYFRSLSSFQLNNDVQEETKSFIQLKIFNKPFDFRDESEFRLVTYSNQNEPGYVDVKDCLVGIILGSEQKDIYDDFYRHIIEKNFPDVKLLKHKVEKNFPYNSIKDITRKRSDVTHLEYLNSEFVNKNFHVLLKYRYNENVDSKLFESLLDVLVYKSKGYEYSEIIKHEPDFDTKLDNLELSKYSFDKLKLNELSKIDLINLQIRKKLNKIFDDLNICINSFDGKQWAIRTLDIISERKSNEYLTELLKDEKKFKFLSIALSIIWTEYFSSVWEEDHDLDIVELCEMFGIESNEEISQEIYKIRSNIYCWINDKYRTFDEILDFFYDEPENIISLLETEKEMENEIDAFNNCDYEGEFKSEEEINQYYISEIDEIDDYNNYLRRAGYSSCSEWICTNFSNDYSAMRKK